LNKAGLNFNLPDISMSERVILPANSLRVGLIARLAIAVLN